MNTKMLALLFAAIFAGPIALNAQEVTLDYTGSIMSGTEYSSHPYGTPPITSPVSGDILTGFITVDGSASAHDLTVTSFDFFLKQGNSISPPLTIGPVPNFVSFTTDDGMVTGARVTWEYQTTGGSKGFFSSFDLGGSGGDSYVSTLSGFVGFPQICDPCGVREGSSVPGDWKVRAPEIDPASAASGLTLMLGALAVLRGRRKLES